METYLIIGRNAIIMMLSIIVFSGFFVAFSTFLIKNTSEEYPDTDPEEEAYGSQ